jgi:hypothetical protein
MLDAVSWISCFGAVFWTLALQYPLLKVHRGRDDPIINIPPTRSEVCIGIVIFWALQLSFDKILCHVMRNGFGGLSSVGILNNQLRYIISDSIPHHTWAVLSGLVLLHNRIWATWRIHRALVFFLDTSIPFARELSKDPVRVLTNVESRFWRLVEFFYHLICVPSETLKLVQDRQPGTQLIQLRRNQLDDPVEGKRTLSWTLLIDKDVLNEMKETLGPPGGFGEMGFSVGKNGIRFEAMGVGTSFNLMFELEEELEKSPELERTRKDQ